MVGYLYFTAYKLKTIRTCMFTHTGPRRGEFFVEPSFAKQIAEIEKGLREPVILVGNLDSIRTFLDVRNVVRAYWLVLTNCEPGEVYNIGDNETMSIKEMLDLLLSMISVRVDVKVDPSRLRPADVTLQIPDCTKFKERTGWEPQIPIRQTLEDLLNYWSANV